MLRRPFLAAALALPALAGHAMAEPFTLGELTIDHPWARPTSAGMANGAAYMVLRNAGSSADRLVAAASEVAERVELHTHMIDAEGVARMREVEAVEVPAGGEAAFQPGGLHVMLIGLREPLAEGSSFGLRLTFEQAGETEVTVNVEKPTAAMQGHGQDHGGGGGHGGGHGHGTAGQN